MNKFDELSIFFPFWNEEENLETVVSKAIPVAQRIAEKWEIIMIDDGSSDKTLEIMHKLSAKDKRLVSVSHKVNRGYGAALKTGFENAKYKYIVFNDGDGQFDFSEVEKFIPKIENADIVIGFRKKRLDHPFRHILMNLLKIWDFVFFGFRFKDIDCGFKLFRRQAIQTILPLNSEGAMITTEILAKAKKANLKILEVEVHHFPRIYGDQSGGNLRVILRAVRESLFLWKELNFKYGRA
ncbi:MAG: glycosyltransferase family 2 protein [Candidatus Levybacteria bacterium CG10_big_fil_rev_8_21_14_0_10_35_13]|nr:MAG: glycosyltransferase family 2 protein [Candidatus Levybacteria bacterium CG10_big_fil_rev_8_21_14_0_10_35_13]